MTPVYLPVRKTTPESCLPKAPVIVSRPANLPTRQDITPESWYGIHTVFLRPGVHRPVLPRLFINTRKLVFHSHPPRRNVKNLLNSMTARSFTMASLLRVRRIHGHGILTARPAVPCKSATFPHLHSSIRSTNTTIKTMKHSSSDLRSLTMTDTFAQRHGRLNRA